MTSLKREEVDAWWGSRSIKSTLPSLVVSLAASAAVVGTAWLLPHDWWAQINLLGILAAYWTAVLLLWIWRIFGSNYRLTSHRLFVEIGLIRRRMQIIELSTIAHVRVESHGVDRFLGVGRVIVESCDAAAPVVLHGVAGPEQVAEKIRLLSARAKG